MDILGHEIDLDFIYYISPIRWNNFSCELWFDLNFKDGRSHRVELKPHYSDTACPRTASGSYNVRWLNKLEKVKQADRSILEKLRKKITDDKKKSQP